MPSWPARSAHREPPAPASRSDSPLGGPRGRAAGHTQIPEKLPRAQGRTGHTQSSGPRTRRRRRRERAQPEAVSSSSVHASPGSDASPVQEEVQEGDELVFRIFRNQDLMNIKNTSKSMI